MGLRAVWASLVLTLGVYLAAAATHDLGRAPALHGDEASFGLAAIALLERGLESLHFANYYTGPLQALAVAASFAVVGPSVLALRSPGLVAHAAALVLLVGALGPGPRAALLLLAVAGSALQLFHFRIAWEVSALQNLFLAGIILTFAAAERRPRPSLAVALLLVLCVGLGTFSHFIFATVPLAMGLGAALLADVEPEDPRAVGRWGALAAAAVLVTIGILGLKPLVSDALFRAAPALVGVGALAGTVGLGLASTSDVVVDRVTAILGRLKPFAARARRVLLGASAAWVIASGLGLGFLEVLAGPVLGYQFAARPAGAALWVAAHAVGALVLYVGVRAVVLTATDRSAPLGLRWAALTVALWPLMLLSTGVWKTSMRYFLPIHLVLLWVVAAWLARGPGGRPRLLGLGALGSSAVVAGVLFWSAILSGPGQRVEKFRIGNRIESAHHFLPLDELLATARREGVCRFEGEHFLVTPLRFRVAAEPFPCDPRKIMSVRSRLDGGGPPWQLGSVRVAP